MKRILILFSLFSTQLLLGQQTVGLFLNDSTSLNGYTLISSLSATESYLIDNCGEISNSWTSSSFRPGPVVYLQNDGSLLKTCKLTTGNFLAGGSGGRLERYNWNDSLIWEYNFDSPTERQHHDINVLPNGNILILSWDLYTKNQAIAAGLDTNHYNGEVWSEKIVEITPIGSDSAVVVWEWKLWDHLIQNFDSTVNNFGTIANNRQLVDLNYSNNNGISPDYFHANGIDYNPILDQIIISVRNYDEFWIIDHSTTTQQAATNAGGMAGMGGDILYRWGNPETYGLGTIADKKLFGQHHPNWIPQGYRDQGKIMVFNNGFNDTNQLSKVQIIDPPVLANGTYTQTPNTAFAPASASWTYELPNFVDFVSGASRLENGNTFITSGPDGHLYEINDNDSIVWEYVNPLEANNVKTSQGTVPSSNTMFRAYRYSENFSAFTNRTIIKRGPLESNPLPSNCILYPSTGTTGLSSVDNSEKIEILAYPNPVMDVLTINKQLASVVNLNVFTVQGQLIHQEQLSNPYHQIDCSQWERGTYVLSFENRNSVTTQKVIKL